MKEPIACLGAGRMGRGIAVVFAYAGHKVSLVDFKPRDHTAFRKLADDNDRPNDCLVEVVNFVCWDPIFEVCLATYFPDVVAVEIALSDLETRHVARTARWNIPVTCDLHRIFLRKDRVENWLLG